MSRQITRLTKPRVSLVPTPAHIKRHTDASQVWACVDTALGLRAMGASPADAIRLYSIVRPHHIYRSFY